MNETYWWSVLTYQITAITSNNENTDSKQIPNTGIIIWYTATPDLHCLRHGAPIGNETRRTVIRGGAVFENRSVYPERSFGTATEIDFVTVGIAVGGAVIWCSDCNRRA